MITQMPRAEPTLAERRRGRRRVAGLISLALWAVMAGRGMTLGVPPATAALGSGVAALGGLACWGLYHALSRRSDGLLLLVFGTMGVGIDRASYAVGARLWMLLFLVPFGAVVGVVVGAKYPPESPRQPLADQPGERIA